MLRNVLSEYDLLDDATCTIVRTADSKTTQMPMSCGTKLSETNPSQKDGGGGDSTVPSEGSSYMSVNGLLTAGKGVLSWASPTTFPSNTAASSSPDVEIFDAGCSTKEAANFIVSFCENPNQLELLRQSPRLLMETLELAHVIGCESLFFDGCLLLGELVKESTREHLSHFLDGSLPSEEMFPTFKEVVKSVREKFRLPRSSRDEDALLETEINAGRIGLTVSSVENEVSDVNASVAKFEENLKYIASFQPNIWQPNSECVVCPDCGKPLQTYFRFTAVGTLSHCRVCGKGKCSDCIKFRVHKSAALVRRPPNELPDRGNFRKVCEKCFKEVTQNARYAFLSNAFMLSGLSVLEISVLRFVCDMWRGAAELCLREYHNMLYVAQFSSQQPKAMQKMVLSSAAFYQGHPQGIIFLARAVDWNDSGFPDKELVVSVILKTLRGMSNPVHHFNPIPHLHMFCTRACTIMAPEMCGYQLLEALSRAPAGDKDVQLCRQRAMELVLCGKGEAPITRALIPLLTDSAFRSSEALDCLIKIAARSPRFALTVYLEALSRERSSLTIKSTGALKTLREEILKSNVVPAEQLRLTGSFLGLLDIIDTTDNGRIATSFAHGAVSNNMASSVVHNISAIQLLESDFALRPFLYPFNPSVVIVGIRLRDTSIKKHSNSQPTLYHLIDDKGNAHKILHKRECVRKDAVVQSIISILYQIISDQHLLWGPDRDAEISLPHYGVLPISADSGLIEIVEGQTLQKINDEYTTSQRLHASIPPSRVTSDSTFHEKAAAHMGNSEDIFVPEDESPMMKSAPLKASFSSPRLPPTNESPLLTTLRSLGNKSSHQRRIGRRFLASAKVFLVLNYLLAIGDRHRDNVVLTPDGYILHIDFGYILGSRPLPEKQLLGAKSYVRFDGDLDSCVRYYQKLLHRVEGQQLTDTDAIDSFLGQTAELFLALRPQTYALLIVLQHLVNNKVLDEANFSAESLSEKLRNITMGGSTQMDARKEFTRRIRESMGAETLRDWVYTKAKSIKALLF